ncbi:MAG: hypothetical protein GXX01_02820 [Clostridiales bacterium]|nr:hypothetical protein [Clostridiales bacterium]
MFFRLTAMILALLMLAGCTRGLPAGRKNQEDEIKPGVTIQPDEQTDRQADEQTVIPGSNYTAADSFGDFLEAKGQLVTLLSDALMNNPGTELDSMALLSIVMVDLLLLPASTFGAGEEEAKFALALLGAQDIVYTENGNQYKVQYQNEEGSQYQVQGVYDVAADALKCTVLVDEKEAVVSEHHKTSFGYVGQIYVVNDDGSANVYQMALRGKDGMIGISEATAAPASLTGGEAVDFPKANKEWYAIEGDRFTGVTADGRELSFIYVPSGDEL